MTTLAGAVPRMMRPGPGQNYPRSGFPLEGMLGPQLIRIPGPGIGCRTPILVSRASSRALPGASSLGASHPKKQKWRGGSRGEREKSHFPVLAANGALCSLQTLGACLACSCRLHVALLLWGRCREKGGQASQHRKQVLFLSTESCNEIVPAAFTFE